MDVLNDNAAARRKPRVVKAAAVRRLELVGLAQRLFLERGYERTTVNDVIAAAGVSKGAFYHHFRAKEDLLEAIAERFARESLEVLGAVRADPAVDAVEKLNGMLARIRLMKMATMPKMRALFAPVLQAENAILYHRIARAVFAAIVPAFAEVIAEGQREGVFDVTDANLAAETMLSLGDGRWRLTVDAVAAAERGDVNGAVRVLAPRVLAEEAMIDRILGLPPGSISLIGKSELQAMLAEWTRS